MSGLGPARSRLAFLRENARWWAVPLAVFLLLLLLLLAAVWNYARPAPLELRDLFYAL